MKYAERDKLVADLESLTEYLKTPAALELPKPQVRIDDWVYIDTNNDDHTQMTRIARALAHRGICEKTTTSSSFTLSRKFGDIKLEYWTSRESICTKKVVGTKLVPERIYQETGNMIEEDIVEWECPPALLSNK